MMILGLLLLRMMAALLALSPDGGKTAGEDSFGEEEAGEDTANLGSPPPPPPPPRPGWTRVIGRVIPVAGLACIALLVLAGSGLALPEPLAGALAEPQTRIGIALAAIAIWSIYLLWRVPQWQAAAWAERAGLSVREQLRVENESRYNLGQLMSGLAVIAGLFFAWQQFGSTVEQVQISQEQQITDRFTNAVEQMASTNLSVRLGGIYALERIARDSPRDLVPSLEVLAAFVRERTVAGMAATPAAGSVVSASADVAAALKVIGRRDEAQVAAQIEQGLECLDLSGMNVPGLSLPAGANLSRLCLAGAVLTGANLPSANFSGSSVQYASFTGANLDDARFDGADLTGARFDGALLGSARFDGAVMTGSSLNGAQLDGASFADAFLLDADLSNAVILSTSFQGADMTEANLSGATIVGSDLSGAIRLTAAQAEGAFIDDGSLLPPGFNATPAAP